MENDSEMRKMLIDMIADGASPVKLLGAVVGLMKHSDNKDQLRLAAGLDAYMLAFVTGNV